MPYPSSSASVYRPQNRPPRLPNILFIQIDDVGLEHLDFYADCNDPDWDAADPYPETPNLTAFAAEAMRFRRCYAMPICSPTKATTLTGRMPEKHLIGNVVNADSAMRFPLTEEPIATIATEVGATYRTIHIGKWHLGLGQDDVSIPSGETVPMVLQQSGFDRYVGCPTNLNNSPNSGYGLGCTLGTVDASGDWYEYDSDTDADTDLSATQYAPVREAALLNAFRAANSQPWFINWWSHSPHTPYHWPHPTTAYAPGLHTQGTDPGTKVWLYWKTMIESLDTLIGSVLDDMSEEEVANTYVIITADNGSPDVMVNNAYVGHGGTAPPDYYNPEHFKTTPYEGGTRVPLMVRGPGITAGSTCDALVTCADFAPTILELTANNWLDFKPAEYDGESLVPLLAGDTDELHDFVHVVTWAPLGLELTDDDVTEIAIAAWSADDDYKLIVLYDESAGDTVIYDEFYKVGSDPTSPFDRHERTALNPDSGPTRQAAYTLLRDYIIEETGLTWPSSIS